MLTVKFHHGNLQLRSTQSTALLLYRHKVTPQLIVSLTPVFQLILDFPFVLHGSKVLWFLLTAGALWHLLPAKSVTAAEAAYAEEPLHQRNCTAIGLPCLPEQWSCTPFRGNCPFQAA